MTFTHCSGVVFLIGKYKEIFREKSLCIGRISVGIISLGEENFGRGKFFRENFTLRGFDRIPIRNFR